MILYLIGVTFIIIIGAIIIEADWKLNGRK
jgi:hypothetical protein